MERYYHLVNENGEEKTFLIRPKKNGDEKEMIECICDEYGATYFKQNFYDEAYLQKESEEGHISFFVAEVVEDRDGRKDFCMGEIAGMMILKDSYPVASMCEIASQIFKKKYRGYGLAMSFFEYGMRVLEKRQYSSAFCLPVLFHDVTQRLMNRFGFIATGLLLNVFDVEDMTHSYDNGRNTKHSQGIQVKKVGECNVGTLYLPKEHAKFCKQIYNQLGVKCKIVYDAKKVAESGVGYVTSKQNEKQHNLEIHIYSVGENVVDQVENVLKNCPLKGKQTANIFLNLCDERAAWAYRQLKEKGWFFTGLRPLCGEWEYMVLHNCGETKVYFEDYHMSDEFQILTNYIMRKRDR